MVDIIIETERDKRALLYLQQVRGDKSISYAITKLAGQRRAYVSNIAKILLVELPENPDCLPLLEKDVVRGEALEARIDLLFAAMGRKRKKNENG